MSDELGIKLKSTFDGKGFDEAEAKAKKTSAAVTQSMNQSSAAAANAATKADESLKKVSASGRVAFQSVGSMASQAGGALGPLTTGVNSMFAALSAGGPILIAATAAFTGLGFVISMFTAKTKEAKQASDEFAASIDKTGTASLALYEKLAKAQGGLNQTQLKFRDWQRDVGDGMVAVYNITTGQWEKVSAAVISSLSGISDNVNAQHQTVDQILRNTRGIDFYRNAIADLKVAYQETGDVVMRADIARHIKELNDEMLRLQNSVGDHGISIAPTKAPSFLAPTPAESAKIWKDDFDIMAASVDEQTAYMVNARNKVNAERQASDQRYHETVRASEAERLAQFYENTRALQDTYSAFTNSLVDTEMTGRQRMRMIGETFKRAVIGQAADIVRDHIAKSLVRQAVDKTSAAISVSTAATAAAAETSASSVATAGWMKTAFAKLVAFYSFLGPFAPVAAGGTIAAAFAALGAIASRALRMQQGGIVPGVGVGDRVPAMLTPGERVINREQYQANRGAIENAIAGKGSGGGNVYLTIHADKDSSTGEMLKLEALIRKLVVPAVEDAIDRGAFRPAYGLGTT